MHKQIPKILLMQCNVFHNNVLSPISLLQILNNYCSNPNNKQNIILSLNNKSKTKANRFGISNNALLSLQLSLLLSQIKTITSNDRHRFKISSLTCNKDDNTFGIIKSCYRQFVDKNTQMNMINDDIINDDNYNLIFPTANVSTLDHNDTISFLEESYESIKNSKIL